MFTFFTHAVMATPNSHVDTHPVNGEKIYQRECLHHIPLTVDALFGFGLILSGVLIGNPYLSAAGGFELAPPIVFYATVSVLACRTGNWNSDFYIHIRKDSKTLKCENGALRDRV